jgi:hypothetical protein
LAESFAASAEDRMSAINGDFGCLLVLLLEHLDYRNQYPVVLLRSTTG